ncbi:hypothetical protein ACFL9U_11960 [Thermodesulfobacteriota bacterium]
MSDKKLLIIHQGALGDVVLTFPAFIRLKNGFDAIDVVCEEQLGRVTRELGLANRWFPLEARVFASLYSDRVDPKIKHVLNAYHTIIIFSFSTILEQAIHANAAGKVHRIPPRHPPSKHFMH